ncbi:hypothetical protein MTR_5g012830 [Medicago truncatula]|uniref:Uncharacterized protein n=1 Tax=Medicago truncatula TaxID=3880 RepID=G7JXC9_MEDTR|nr:hypothetical protein MTR_5g012830 [Medicago truncatula]
MFMVNASLTSSTSTATTRTAIPCELEKEKQVTHEEMEKWCEYKWMDEGEGKNGEDVETCSCCGRRRRRRRRRKGLERRREEEKDADSLIFNLFKPFFNFENQI